MMLDDLFQKYIIDTMKFSVNDLELINRSETDLLFNIKLNNIECGLLSITTDKSLERSSIILSNYIKNTHFDFFINLNEYDLVVMLTDHKNTLIPQYIPLKNKNQIELICGKSFLKNLIANRGVEYYDCH